MNKFYKPNSENQYPKFLFFDYEKYSNEMFNISLTAIDFNQNNYSSPNVYDFLTTKSLLYKDEYMQKAIQTVNPKNIDELSIVLALASPSRISILEEEVINTIPKEFKSILKNNYNRVIFREEQILILTEILNCSIEDAEVYRKDLSRNKELLNFIVEKCAKYNFADLETFINKNFIRYSNNYIKQDIALKFAKIIYKLAELEHIKTQKDKV